MANLSYHRLTSKGLPVACALLFGLSGAGDRQDHLRLQLHVTWAAEYHMTYAHEGVSGQETDHIEVSYDGLLRTTSPAGEMNWDTSPETMDERVTVSGGGGGTITGKGEHGEPISYSQSWDWVLKDATKPLYGGVSTSPNGNFSINLPSTDGIKIELRMHPGNTSGGLEQAMNGLFGAMMLTPRVGIPGYPMADPNFAGPLQGTFDPKNRSFSKSGTAHASDVPERSTGAIPGLDSVLNTKVDVTYTLSLNQEPEDVEAILIPPDGYGDWRPKAGKDEDAPGEDPMVVQVVLLKKGEDKPPRATAQFKFELVGTSQQPGVCLNWPPKDTAKSDFDLSIDQKANSGLQVDPDSKGQTASSKSGLQGSAVTVVSHDWGGWANLKVTAILDDSSHTQIVAHLQGQPGAQRLSIPKDDNGNHIADGWERSEAPPSEDAKSDDDDFPHNEGPQGDGDAGDGLSLYEEYRGFMVKGSHVSTSPKQKDVFVFDRHLLGVGSFGMSHLNIHLVNHDEFHYEPGDDPNPRVINFNNDYAHLGNEHVIELLNNYGQGRLGYTEGGPDVPKYIRYVVVDKNLALASKYKQAEVDVTIAHELAHATNVAHHGDGNYDVPYAGEHYLSPRLCKGPNQRGGYVAVQGGQNSGAQECIMRYYRADYAESEAGGYCLPTTDAAGNPTFNHGASYGPTQTPGTVFCTSNLGTGMNGRFSPSRTANLGDATRGDCSHQFCVNDAKHPKKREE